MTDWKQCMINSIRAAWFYEEGELENMTEEEVWEIHERLIDWLNGQIAEVL